MAASYSQMFAGRRILIFEDEYLLADETRYRLEQLGAIVVGPTGQIDVALQLIDNEHVDAAILDIHLEGELVFPVAERLVTLDIEFVFASGYDASVLPDKFKGFVLNEKPIDLENIARALFGPKRDLH